MRLRTKKFIAFVLAMGVVISATACGGDTGTSRKDKDGVGSAVSSDSNSSDCNLSITVHQSSTSGKDEGYRLFHEGMTFTSVTQDEQFTYVHYEFDNKLGYSAEFSIAAVLINNQDRLDAYSNDEPYLGSEISNWGICAKPDEKVEGAFVFANIKAEDDIWVLLRDASPDDSSIRPGIHFTFEEGDGSVSVVTSEDSVETEDAVELDASSENEDVQAPETLVNELDGDIEWGGTSWGDLNVYCKIPKVLSSNEDNPLVRKGNSLVKSYLRDGAKILSPFEAYHTWYYSRDDATPNVWLALVGVGTDGYTKVSSNSEAYDSAIPYIELVSKYAYCDDFKLDYETFDGTVSITVENEEERLYPKGDDPVFVNKPPYAPYATDEKDFYWLSKSGTITVDGSEGKMAYKFNGCFVHAFEISGVGLGNLRTDTPMILFTLSKDADEETLDKIVTHAYETMYHG